MKFIEIKEGTSIAIEKIESISEVEGKTFVVTPTTRYESTFPYFTLLQIIEGEDEEKEEKKHNTLEEIKQGLSRTQFFAG